VWLETITEGVANPMVLDKFGNTTTGPTAIQMDIGVQGAAFRGNCRLLA
jgi:hypothetical protein